MNSFWEGRSVLLTGHTGFKGGWLALWLSSMGARVHGFSLPAEACSFYSFCKIHDLLASEVLADLSDRKALGQYIQRAQPEVVFHLAAQSLVRLSYNSPVETFATNVMGTVNLLEALRESTARAVVNVTSDKCYENREDGRAYQESDAMGGHDPYSASKGCAELVTASYRRSFLSKANIQIATARAGNVIGGGDWSQDRLVPDFLRASDDGRPLVVRSPLAIRPWQHVLDPLNGYLTLAEQLATKGASLAQGWNFGPDASDSKNVGWIADELSRLVPGSSWMRDASANPHEATLLALDSSLVRKELGWEPHWNVTEALRRTCEWHRAWKSGSDMRAVSLSQIGDYCG